MNIENITIAGDTLLYRSPAWENVYTVYCSDDGIFIVRGLLRLYVDGVVSKIHEVQYNVETFPDAIRIINAIENDEEVEDVAFKSELHTV